MKDTIEICCSLYAFYDGDHVWFQCGVGDKPQKFAGTIDEFVQSSLVDASVALRIPGSGENAALICQLYERRAANPLSFPRVFVGSPSQILRTSDMTIPSIFDRMCALELSPSVGGWHEVSIPDYHAYKLRSEYENANGRLTVGLCAALRKHPAWQAISFSPDADLLAAASMLVAIVDPRWHVDPEQPDNLLWLFGHLGLHENLYNAEVKKKTKAPRWLVSSARSVLRAWSGGKAVGNKPADPRQFFWRIAKFIDDKIAPENADASEGMFRASRLFLRFVFDVWLHNARSGPVLPGDGRPRLTVYAPTLFVARHFFYTSTDTLDAWNKHISTH